MLEWILSSCVLILVVIGLRFCFRGRLSQRLQYALWGLVLLRLLIPVSFGSTGISVANLTSPEKTAPVVAHTVTPGEHSQGGFIGQVTPPKPTELPLGDVPRQEPVATESAPELFPYILAGVWAAGCAAVAGMFLFTNLRFRRSLRASRRRLGEKGRLVVYVTDQVDTPCLFGLFCPAIYVTQAVAGDETLLRHTLEHEATHYSHGDHIWAVLRCLCLAIHWYDPLVWWAAFLSQRDGELACDEGTIRKLGEGERAEYGRTLIGMTCRKRQRVLTTATTMTGSRSTLRERILRIAGKPKMAVYTLVAVLLLAAVAVGCTFTGPNTAEPESDPESLFHWGEILDIAGNVLVRRPLTDPTDETVEQNPETQLPEETIGLPEVLHREPEYDKICIAVQPTGWVTDGSGYLYIIPQEQELLMEYYLAAQEASEPYFMWDHDQQRTGWKLVYRDQWWQTTENGEMFGADPTTWEDIRIGADSARQLYAFCDDQVKQAGLAEPVRPKELVGIRSATLYWNGEHRVTDPEALAKLEAWLSNSREESSVSCWFTAQLSLELENGETKTIAMATDSCATWMSEGVVYHYGQATPEGIQGNEEFYSLFASGLIHDSIMVVEGKDVVTDIDLFDYLIYLDWNRYAKQYGVDETLSLMDRIEQWAAEEPTAMRFGGVIQWAQGVDGAYADYYAGLLARLYALAPGEFAWACLGNASDAQQQQTMEMLAYHWNLTVGEVQAKLQADLP